MNGAACAPNANPGSSRSRPTRSYRAAEGRVRSPVCARIRTPPAAWCSPCNGSDPRTARDAGTESGSAEVARSALIPAAARRPAAIRGAPPAPGRKRASPDRGASRRSQRHRGAARPAGRWRVIMARASAATRPSYAPPASARASRAEDARRAQRCRRCVRPCARPAEPDQGRTVVPVELSSTRMVAGPPRVRKCKPAQARVCLRIRSVFSTSRAVSSSCTGEP